MWQVGPRAGGSCTGGQGSIRLHRGAVFLLWEGIWGPCVGAPEPRWVSGWLGHGSSPQGRGGTGRSGQSEREQNCAIPSKKPRPQGKSSPCSQTHYQQDHPEPLWLDGAVDGTSPVSSCLPGSSLGQHQRPKDSSGRRAEGSCPSTMQGCRGHGCPHQRDHSPM